MKIIGCLVGLLSFFFAEGQEFNKVSERTKKAIDSTYTALIKKHNVVGMSLAIVDNNEIVYSTGYGFADRENKVVANDQTIYPIYSCTKSFTSLSILQLQERGKLKITNSMKDFIPELKITNRFNDDNPLYMQDMLCHVSGLPWEIRNGNFSYAPPNINWVIEELKKQSTISPRRYMFSYSNIAYALLGEVVARTEKTTYENYLKENIFKPLQMNSSFIKPEEVFLKRISKGYVKNKEIKEPLIRDVAAYGMYSNAIDMAHYLQMYLKNGSYNGNQIISPVSLKDMQENHLKDVLLSSSDISGYGIFSNKVWVKTGKDSTVVSICGHSGDGFAFHADFGFSPELNVGVVLLTNTDKGQNIRSPENLLDLYLKVEKSKTINFNYAETGEINLDVAKENTPKEMEIIGKYNMGDVLVDVTRTKKIKYKDGSTKIVLKQKRAEPAHYSVNILLLGFIPVNVKDEEIVFVKLNNEIYMKEMDIDEQVGEFVAVKAKPLPVSNIWTEKFGNYVLTGSIYKCENCPFPVSEKTNLKLYMKSGFLVIKTSALAFDRNTAYYLDLVSDSLAITGGMGSQTGETVRILDNGNIYFSGFEFKRK